MAAFHLALNEFDQESPKVYSENHLEILQEDEPSYAQSLILSLQSNMNDLKIEARALKNQTFRETGNSAVQTLRSIEKVLDYRKPVQKKQSKASKVQEKPKKTSKEKIEKVDFPIYGRGVDPSPDVNLYMKKTVSSNFSSVKKMILEKNFEKYLSEKQAKNKADEENRPFF